MKKVKKFFENGRTMLEMLAVLAIIASIGIGISAGITHGLTVYRASILQTQLPQIKKAIETTYSFNPKINKYANIDNISGQQYTSIFGDILGKDACTNAGCKTAGGLLSLHAIAGGKGFAITFTDMPKGICQELADVARGKNNSILSSGFVMANSCNEDSKQTIDFATTTEEGGNCSGNQLLIDGTCQCLRSDAIGEECILPNTEKTTPPVTTTTTTEAARYTSKEKDPETDVVDSALIHTAETIEATTDTVDTQTPSTENNPESTTGCVGFMSPFPIQCNPCDTPDEVLGVYEEECKKCPNRELYERDGEGAPRCRLKQTQTTEEPTTTMTTYATETPTTITTYVTETSMTTNGIANVEGGNTTITVATETPTTTAGATTLEPTTTREPETTTAGATTLEPTTTREPETTTPDVSTETSTPLTETTTPDVSTETLTPLTETMTPLTETMTPDVSTELTTTARAR